MTMNNEEKRKRLPPVRGEKTSFSAFDANDKVDSLL